MSSHNSVDAHKYSDVDTDQHAQHHTLGVGANQAAPGDHTHPDHLGLVPIGAAIPYFDDVSPDSNWLICNGASFSSTDYPILAARLGGTTLPDMRDRLPVGASGTKALLSTGGSDTHTLLAGNLPPHQHRTTISTAAGTNGSRIAPGVATQGTGSIETDNGTGLNSTPVNHVNKYLAVNYLMRGR